MVVLSYWNGQYARQTKTLIKSYCHPIEIYYQLYISEQDLMAMYFGGHSTSPKFYITRYLNETLKYLQFLVFLIYFSLKGIAFVETTLNL